MSILEFKQPTNSNYTKENIQQLFTDYKANGKSFYLFTDPIFKQNTDDEALKASMWLCGRMDMDETNTVYIEDAKAYISLYDYALGIGMTIEDLEKWLDCYGGNIYVDTAVYKNADPVQNPSSDHAYTNVTCLNDSSISSPHILVYKFNNEDMCNLLIPCSSMTYFQCVISVFLTLVTHYPPEHEAHAMLMDRYDGLLEALEPYFTLSQDETIADNDDNPVFRVNRQYWAQFCPELANATNGFSNSVN